MPGAVSAVTQIQLFDAGPNVSELRERAALFVLSAQAANTRRSYESDYRIFRRWCTDAGRSSMPATTDTLRLFISAELEHRAISTTERRIAAIVDAHRQAGADSPHTDETRELMRGARRAKGTAPKQKAALDPKDLRKICSGLMQVSSAVAVRDRALLTMGFAAAMRRSEICALDLADLRFATKGIAIALRRSKTDQEGRGREVGIFHGSHASTCPVRAIRAWLRIRGSQPGPLFPGGRTSTTGRLSGRTVSDIVKRCAGRIGLDAAEYGAHSLRAGCVTAAILANAPAPLIMKRTGHRSMATLEKYVRTATLFEVDVLKRAM